MPDSVTARFTQALLDATVRQGVAVPAPLQQALREAQARVPLALQDELWALYCGACGEPLASLRMGADIQAGHLDIVGMLLLSCDTLGDGLEVLTEYAPIIGDNARFELVACAETVTVRYLPDYTVCRAQRVEAVMGAVVSLARWMTSGRFQPLWVGFMHAPRAAAADYTALLGCPVRFHEAADGLAIDSAALQLGLIQAGPQLHAHLKQLADEMLASLRQGGFSEQVQQLIRAQPRWGKERVAGQLGVSGRQLNRRLAAEAISFKSLREAILYEMARKLLRRGEAVTAVSEQLGFSDENAFARAFRRWSGQTPAQFSRTA